MITMRKLRNAALFCAAMAAPAVFAQGESSSTFDLSAAGDAATEVGSALSTLIKGDVKDAVLAVMGASLVIWVLYRVVRWAMRAAK